MLQNISNVLEAHIKEDNVRFGEIIDKLHKVETQLSNLIILNTETLKSQMSLIANNQTVVNKHNEFIFGNGNGEKGISLRIDRLEGSEESRKWTFRAIWAALITLLTKVFYDLIKH